MDVFLSFQTTLVKGKINEYSHAYCQFVFLFFSFKLEEKNVFGASKLILIGYEKDEAHIDVYNKCS